VDAQHAAGVVAYPDRPEADAKPDWVTAHAKARDDAARTLIDTVDHLRVEISDPERAEPDCETNRRNNSSVCA
jgi:hypothetical protein